MSKYPVIMELDAELKRRNEEIFAVEQERGNLEIELSECSGVFKKKQRKELQEKISSSHEDIIMPLFNDWKENGKFTNSKLESMYHQFLEKK